MLYLFSMTTSDKNSVKRGKDGRIMHPNSLANLPPTQWQKGVSGNSGGNGYSLLSELKHALNKQKREDFVNSTIEGAILREPTPFKELWERIEGKVPQPLTGKLELTHDIAFIIGKGYQDGNSDTTEAKDTNQV